MNWKITIQACLYGVATSILSLYPGIRALADTTPPVITHEIVKDAVPAGTPFVLNATVRDESSVSNVRLNFKLPTQREFSNRKMEESAPGQFAAELSGDEVVQPVIEYFITAQDSAGNSQSRGFAFDPLKISVGPSAMVDSTAIAKKESLTVRSTNRIWYVVGTVAAIVVVASLGGKDTVESNGCPCVGLEL